MAQNIQEQELDLQELQGKTEKFINDNKVLVLSLVGLVLLLAVIYFGFTRVVIPNQEKSAQADMYVAQQYFAKDSFNLALIGDDNYPGFADIIDNYSGFTKSTNLAKYYAGICNLNLGNYDEAIDYLQSYSGNDQIVAAVAKGALGDAFMQKGDTASGIKYYKQAASSNENEFSSPIYLLKAAMAMEKSGQTADAASLYEKLKTKYANTPQGRDAEKLLARAQAK